MNLSCEVLDLVLLLLTTTIQEEFTANVLKVTNLLKKILSLLTHTRKLSNK